MTGMASVLIDLLLNTRLSKFPMLAHRIDTYQHPIIILKDMLVQDWCMKTMHVNAANVACFKYTILKITQGIDVPQLSIKWCKVSTVCFTLHLGVCQHLVGLVRCGKCS
jgi:hypothetical protein